MNALAPFAPVLALSLGSLGYLVSGHLLERARLTSLFALGLIGAAAYLIVGLLPMAPTVPHGFIVNDFSKFFAILACLGAFVSVIGTASSLAEEKIGMLSEYYFLMLTSLCGALVMIFASDFLTLFIGIEVASLALYCLCGSRVTKEASSEVLSSWMCEFRVHVIRHRALVRSHRGARHLGCVRLGAACYPLIPIDVGGTRVQDRSGAVSPLGSRCLPRRPNIGDILHELCRKGRSLRRAL